MSPVVYGVLLTELLVVAWVDLKQQKIYNFWFIVNLLLSLIFHLVFREIYPLSWEIAVFPLGFFVFGFLLFLLNIMGAGDSKFLASLFLVVPLQYQWNFFEKILLVTIFIGSVFLGMKFIKNFSTLKAYIVNRHWQGVKETIRSRFSYAPVILIAWILLGVEVWR